jgi:hypothetical protein
MASRNGRFKAISDFSAFASLRLCVEKSVIHLTQRRRDAKKGREACGGFNEIELSSLINAGVKVLKELGGPVWFPLLFFLRIFAPLR